MDAGEPGKPSGKPCGKAFGVPSEGPFGVPSGVRFRAQLHDSFVSALTRSLRGDSSPGLARILKSVHDAVRQDAMAPALRSLDRAWRCFANEALIVAPLYARALLLDGGDFEAALGVAQIAGAAAPDPDIAAIQVVALLRLQRIADAVRLLETALADYLIVADGALACAADELVQHAGVDIPGWIGQSPTLDLISRLSQSDDLEDVDVQVQDGRRYARHRGVRLLGSGARAPDDFRLDGRAKAKGRRLTAWARLGSLPGVAPVLRFADERRRFFDVETTGPAQPGWRWPYKVNLESTRLRGDSIQISARLPDGAWCALPDAPLLLRGELLQPKRAPARTSKRQLRLGRRHIDVIIPVYGNRLEALACIESALRTTAGLARIVVIDDASTDPLLTSALDQLVRDANVTLLRNVKNLGFAGAVNRGLAHDATRDAILLNSDTLVFGDWLMRMQAAAYSDPLIGTVTPLSNNGSIASYPRPSGNDALPPIEGAQLNYLAGKVNAGRRIEIPVGVGFCLYLKRDCLDAVGNLDAAVFGKGYGEETDLCLRARNQGWTHRLAADVYVSHAGGASFGTRRAALLDRSQRLLNLRHPGFDQSIVRFHARDPAHGVRRDLDAHRLRAHAGRHVLVVTLALSGGVDRFVKDRCHQLRALGFTPILLRPVKPKDLDHCELVPDGLDLPNLQYDIPSELPALQELLRSISCESIEIQHFLDLDARVIEVVRALPSAYDVFIHDYVWMCPRITLIDGSGRHCGEPAATVCETCVKRNGSSLREVLSVKALRARSSTWLRGAQRVIAPTEDTAARLKRHFAGLCIEVRPHTAALPAPTVMPQPRRSRDAEKPVRIALVGAIGGHKGYEVLLACARDARARRLPIEFIVIGYTENDAPLLATGKVFITGPYIDGEAPHLIAREQPDAVWLPSVWPETWCYTLDYALGARLPVIAFDLGAIAERLRSVARYLLMPLTTKSQRINETLLDFIAAPPVAAPAAPNSVKSLPTRARRMASIDDNQLSETSMVKSVKEAAPTPGQDAGLSASVHVLPLPSGLYLFSVKEAKPQVSSGAGQLALPAMHVGLGPGIGAEQAEFLSSTSAQGSWLVAATDQLVTRVNAAGATLMITSVRAPNGSALSIKVERLDARAAAVETSAKEPATALKLVANDKPANAPLSVRISAHIRARGDMQFTDAPWSGRVGAGLWIESFSVLPMEHLGAHDIEYKGLTGSGFETPWLSDNAACGSKGMGVPLIGFAVRLRPSTTTAGFDCEYSGYFQSGLSVGPLRNGAPCRSSVANDPLEGIQVRLVKRAAVASAPSPGVLQSDTPKADANGRKPVAAKSKSPAVAAVKPGKRVALAR